ncbi:Pol protein [Phytophthora palmivora]|uniref:Pol protein n=1 Tax=Phytophthora palmivora TaxID=4796 RepID=A0A2P4X3X2_9STRA|nr:Pol protein [Phytophthora palmivora]
MVILKSETSPEDLNYSSVMDEDDLEGLTKQRAMRLVLRFSRTRRIQCILWLNNSRTWCRTIHHLNPHRIGEYDTRSISCLAQCAVSRGSGLYPGLTRESKSPHSTPTFCVRKPNVKWRLVHAYNKLNSAMVPAQMPIPVLLNNMSVCTLYSALDLVNGYYQILMRESDVSLTGVNTPSRIVWK